MKKRILPLVGLILVLVSIQIVVTSSDVSSYDLMADINRDRIVDASDLARLGKAYGSSLVLPSEPNKTVVTVLSFDGDPPEVENATVVIFDPELFNEWFGDPIDIQCTNSSGIATFELGPSKNYTAIVWSGSAHNYANFTTDTLGEASPLVLLGEPSGPPIHSLPQGWVVITVINNQTGSIYSADTAIVFDRLKWGGDGVWSGQRIESALTPMGVYVTSRAQTSKPYSRIGIGIVHPDGNQIGYTVYSPDANGCANVIVYVTPP